MGKPLALLFSFHIFPEVADAGCSCCMSGISCFVSQLKMCREVPHIAGRTEELFGPRAVAQRDGHVMACFTQHIRQHTEHSMRPHRWGARLPSPALLPLAAPSPEGTTTLYLNAICMLGTVPSDASVRMPAADVYSSSKAKESVGSAATTWNRTSNCSALAQTLQILRLTLNLLDVRGACLLERAMCSSSDLHVACAHTRACSLENPLLLLGVNISVC